MSTQALVPVACRCGRFMGYFAADAVPEAPPDRVGWHRCGELRNCFTDAAAMERPA